MFLALFLSCSLCPDLSSFESLLLYFPTFLPYFPHNLIIILPLPHTFPSSLPFHSLFSFSLAFPNLPISLLISPPKPVPPYSFPHPFLPLPLNQNHLPTLTFYSPLAHQPLAHLPVQPKSSAPCLPFLRPITPVWGVRTCVRHACT